MYFPFWKLWYKRPFSEYFSGSPGGSVAGGGGTKGILLMAQVSLVSLISSAGDRATACLSTASQPRAAPEAGWTRRCEDVGHVRTGLGRKGNLNSAAGLEGRETRTCYWPSPVPRRRFRQKERVANDAAEISTAACEILAAKTIRQRGAMRSGVGGGMARRPKEGSGKAGERVESLLHPRR